MHKEARNTSPYWMKNELARQLGGVPVLRQAALRRAKKSVWKVSHCACWNAIPTHIRQVHRENIALSWPKEIMIGLHSVLPFPWSTFFLTSSHFLSFKPLHFVSKMQSAAANIGATRLWALLAPQGICRPNQAWCGARLEITALRFFTSLVAAGAWRRSFRRKWHERDSFLLGREPEVHPLCKSVLECP